jgi:hypothetical protein
MFGGAKGIEAVEKLMKTSSESAIANIPAAPAVTADEIAEMRFAVDKRTGERKMSVDAKYRDKVEALEAKLYT